MKLHKTLAVAAAALMLGSFQTANATNFPAIDLGSAGTINAGTLIPIPTLDFGSGSSIWFDFQFVVDNQPMGHIELLDDTQVHLLVDFNNPDVGALLVTNFAYYLTDMNHNPLPGTDRDMNLPGVVDGNAIFVQPDHPGTGIGPNDVEPGGYFHDIHFNFPDLPPLANQPIDAWIAFSADVQTGTWVPEPSSFAALASLGLVGAAFGAFRRRRQAKNWGGENLGN